MGRLDIFTNGYFLPILYESKSLFVWVHSPTRPCVNKTVGEGNLGKRWYGWMVLGAYESMSKYSAIPHIQDTCILFTNHESQKAWWHYITWLHSQNVFPIFKASWRSRNIPLTIPFLCTVLIASHCLSMLRIRQMTPKI